MKSTVTIQDYERLHEQAARFLTERDEAIREIERLKGLMAHYEGRDGYETVLRNAGMLARSLESVKKSLAAEKRRTAALAYQCADLQRGGVDALKEPARSWFVDRDDLIEKLKAEVADLKSQFEALSADFIALRDKALGERQAGQNLVKAAKLVCESHRRACPGESCGTMGIDLLDMELKSYAVRGMP